MISGYTKEQKKVIWKWYIEYLQLWIEDCKDSMFYGESPDTFDEKLEDWDSDGELADYIDKYFIKKT